jgi:hypothetical protein
MLGWLRRRRNAKALTAENASALMQDFGDDAYFVARRRSIAALRGELIDADRGADHWSKVRAEIGRSTGREFVDTATRYTNR